MFLNLLFTKLSFFTQILSPCLLALKCSFILLLIFFFCGCQITAAGLPVEQELDVAVDFVAPNLPGRYVSYWRMATPSGQKFGQRVWVLIQVRKPSSIIFM